MLAVVIEIIMFHSIGNSKNFTTNETYFKQYIMLITFTAIHLKDAMNYILS